MINHSINIDILFLQDVHVIFIHEHILYSSFQHLPTGRPVVVMEVCTAKKNNGNLSRVIKAHQQISDAVAAARLSSLDCFPQSLRADFLRKCATSSQRNIELLSDGVAQVVILAVGEQGEPVSVGWCIFVI
jgi:hypothetical protein